MTYKKEQLKPYIKAGADLIPINTWNKQVKGVKRGKTPLHNDWTNREYKRDAYKGWIENGYNIGLRIAANQVIIDLDPRNYKGEDCETLIAELFGFFDFEELTWELPVVRTGGGGWHIYCTLPENVDYSLLRETIEELPGVEFKRKGRQVLCAGSKHPSGEYYNWENEAEPAVLPEDILAKIKREAKPDSGKYTSGKGSLTGTQLSELILEHLEATDYDDNDTWFPLLCGAHHATDGEGVDEFVYWCTQDPKYRDSENQIRSRWASLDDKKDNLYTIGTLIRELDKHGEDSSGVKAMLSFQSQADLEIDDEDTEEAELLNQAKRIASEIDISDIYDDPEMEDGVEGAALIACNDLPQDPSGEEIAKCLRLIKNADMYEAVRATKVLQDKTKLSKSAINQMLKELEAKINRDLGRLISDKTLEVSFNKGKHLTCPPSGMLYGFRNTHWIPLSDEFMGKLVQTTLYSLKEKMDIDGQELSLINQAVKLSRIGVATLKDKLHRTELPHSVINCKNGELWLERDGSHTLKPHNYRSYLLNCLNVDYDPSADCPLFKETLYDIFEHFPDTEDMVRHIGEMLGYTIQPYKNIASWWLFRGPGGDGKSTILKILEGILQDAQLMTGVKLLSLGSNESYNHAANSLIGKLSVIIEELPANYLLKDAGMKMLSENTKMEANPKGSEAFNFMYSGNLIMCSNGFPATRDLSHGMFRRANVIPFNRQFDKDNSADLDRPIKILQDPQEMSGVLNFMLEGLQRLRNRGRFEEPESCKLAKEEWLGHANNVVRFVKENIESTNAKDCVGDFGTIYDLTYQSWCQENDIEDKMRKKKQHFKRDLIDLGFIVKPGGGNVLKVYGGKLIHHEEEDDLDDF
jgi:P4 family phage/plasmid primase-like protien